MIFLTGGDATAADDAVGIRSCRKQCLHRTVERIGNYPAIHYIMTEPLYQRTQHVKVRVVNLSGLQRFARAHQFITGGEHGNPQRPANDHGLSAHARQHTNIGSPQAMPRLEQQRTPFDIAARTAHILSGLYRLHDDNFVTFDAAILLHYYGVRARWDRCAGENAGGAADCKRLTDPSGRNSLSDTQSVLPASQCLAVHGIPVHGTVGMTGDVDRCMNGFRQHSVQRPR